MKVGLIVAMQKELEMVLNMVNEVTVKEINGFKFYIGRIAGADVVSTTCGIGKVNAALGTMTMIDAFHPDIVINSGVAGGTGGGAKVMDVVIADRIAYHDVWCGPGTEWGEAAGCPRYFQPPMDVQVIANQAGAKCGLIASGDIFVSRVEDLRRILSIYPQAIAVDMESAAVAQTCYLKDVPMICIRIISDTPGSADNIAQYQNFWDDAPKQTFATVLKIINMF